jgi:hypothetical protein
LTELAGGINTQQSAAKQLNEVDAAQ